jgi:adhesin transport system outer membrane protein
MKTPKFNPSVLAVAMSLATSLGAGPALAQAPGISAPGVAAATAKAPGLNLLAAVEQVDATHPLIKSKRQELAATESGKSAAWQQMLPSLSASRTRGNTGSNSQINTISVQQPLFAGGRITGGMDRAEAFYEEALAGLELTRRDLASRSAAVYIEVIKARQRLAVAQTNVQTHEELLASIDRRVGAEVSPESDLLLTRSRLSQAQSERTQIMLSLQLSEDSLRELLLVSDLPNLIPPKVPPSRLENLQVALDQATSFSPEIRQLIARESGAKSDVKIQKAAAFPSVFVRHDQFSGDLGLQAEKQATYVAVEFQPGAGFSVGSNVKAAESRRLSAIDARQAAEKDARDRIRSLWAERESLRIQATTNKAYVESAQSVAESFSRQFNIGRKTWVEVLNAKREAALAELNLTEIEWNAIRAAYQLEIQTGQLRANQESAPQENIESTPVKSN